MVIRTRAAIAPIYLFACIVLGGSAQGVWQNALLQLGGLALIAWAALNRGTEPMAPPARQLLLLTVAALVVVVLQLVLLPAAFWSHLGGRAELAQGYRLLGIGLPAQPLSLTPAASLNSLLGIIPGLGLLCSMIGLKAYRPRALAVALIAGTVTSIALGALQVAGSNGSELSPWYLYENTNDGKAVGFFANADHQATLLVMTIPFLAAIAAAARTTGTQRYSAMIAIAAGLGLVVMVGIALNGSLAGYALAIAVLASTAIIVVPPGNWVRLWIAALAALLALGAITALEVTPIGAADVREHATNAADSRRDILVNTSRAIRDFMPFGSGLGSFRSVYHLYEQPAQVTPTFVIHVHNDYVETALELGVAGVLLILLFLAWWTIVVWRVWRTAERGPFARAATIASAAVLLHSLVDFPLRTATISACFAMCLAFLGDSRAAPPKEKAQLRGRRHVEFR